MKFTFPLLVVMAGLLCLPACDTFTSNAQRVARAQQDLSSGNYGAALVELRNVITKEPENSPAQLALAQLSLQTGDLESVDKALSIAMKSGGEPALVARLRARRMLSAGQFEPLLAQIDSKGLQLAPTDRALYRGQALKGLDRLTAAAAEFEQAIKAGIEPQLTKARIGLAETHAAQGNALLARRTLETAVGENSKSAQAWLALGILQQRLGEAQKSEQALHNAATHASGQLALIQHVLLLNVLADAHLGRGEIAAARTQYENLLKVAPEGVPARLLAARLMQADGNAAGAVTELQRLLKRTPTLAQAKTQLIGALLAERSLEQANRLLGEAVQSAGNGQDAAAQPSAGDARLQAVQIAVQSMMKSKADSETYLLDLAAAEYALGLPEAARAALTDGVTRYPASQPMARARIGLELRLGNVAAALDGAMKLAAASPDDAVATAMLGEANLRQQRYPQAEEAFARSWALDRTAPVAMALHRMRRIAGLPGANDPLEQWLVSNPRDAAVRSMLAEALMSTGDQDRAVKEYELVLAQAPKNATVLNNLAWLYHGRGDARALDLARRAHELAPAAPAIVDTYGWLLLEAGKRDEALPLLAAAARSAPTVREIAYHYAVALARSRQPEQARRILEEVLANPASFANRPEAEALLRTL